MAAEAPEKVPDRLKGYLTITIAEASGRNRDDEEVWDPAFVEGYVKGALKCRNSGESPELPRSRAAKQQSCQERAARGLSVH